MATIYKRGKVWWARAQRNGVEERESLRTADRSIAEKRLREWLSQLDASAWGDRPRRSFAEASAKFIREHLTTIKPSSAERYGVSLKNLSLHFGTMTLDQIGSASLGEFETLRRGHGVKAGTIRRDLACLSSMFTSAIEWEWLDDGCNPVPSFLRRRAKRGLKEAPGRKRYLTEAEEAALLAKASPAVRDAVILAIETGLRRDELFGLTWRQINWTDRTIDTTTKTKSGRSRTVPLPERAGTLVGTFPRHLECPFVFVNPETGTRYGKMNRGLAAAARRAGIRDLRWHDLRRTAGCRWLQRDRRSMEEVSKLLGHSSVAVTEKSYAFLIEQDVARDVAAQKRSQG